MQRRSRSPQNSSRAGSRQGWHYYSEPEETSSSLVLRRTRTDSASRSPPPSYTSTSRLAHADGVLPIYYFPTVEPLPPDHGLESVPREMITCGSEEANCSRIPYERRENTNTEPLHGPQDRREETKKASSHSPKRNKTSLFPRENESSVLF
ncbi:predicted protein [Histoplasma capsulatum H143]|uniref:Uncharacterized protein n=1 Tax=Ajellomyces capsulatus (strain H143) TaxID=544712 RepID=C6HK02_AJECH|nr:predicted protein [Histoplasma capsulatum H143]